MPRPDSVRRAEMREAIDQVCEILGLDTAHNLIFQLIKDGYAAGYQDALAQHRGLPRHRCDVCGRYLQLGETHNKIGSDLVCGKCERDVRTSISEH